MINGNTPGSLPGDHYLAAYRSALARVSPTHVLHLCDLAKLAAILQSHHRDQFLADIAATHHLTEPLLFQRSAQAWASYPRLRANAPIIRLLLDQIEQHDKS